MKIAIIAPLHHYNLYSRQEDKVSEFYMGQGQYHWSSALKEMNHDVLEIRSTDIFNSFILNKIINENKTISRLLNIFTIYAPESIKKFIPIFSSKIKRDLMRLLAFEPNLIIFSGGVYLDIYSIAFFEKLKNGIPNTKMVLLNGTSPICYNSRFEKKIVKYIDCFFTNDFYHAAEWKMLGAKKSVALPISAINPRIHYLRNKKVDRCYDVSFVGTFYDDRHKVFEYLYEKGINIVVWGRIAQYIPANSKFWEIYKGEANPIDLLNIISSSKISINLNPNQIQHGGNMRTFEIPSVKTLQIIDRYDHSWFLEGKEIVSFGDKEELLEKIRYYLKNDKERIAIAVNGYNKVLNQHTYYNRMEKLIGEL